MISLIACDINLFCGMGPWILCVDIGSYIRHYFRGSLMVWMLVGVCRGCPDVPCSEVLVLLRDYKNTRLGLVAAKIKSRSPR